MNSLKNGEGVSLLNFEKGPRVPLLNFECVLGPGSWVLGSWGMGSQGLGTTFTPCPLNYT